MSALVYRAGRVFSANNYNSYNDNDDYDDTFIANVRSASDLGTEETGANTQVPRDANIEAPSVPRHLCVSVGLGVAVV